MILPPASGTTTTSSSGSSSSNVDHDASGLTDCQHDGRNSGIPIIDVSPWTRPAQHYDTERQSTVMAVERACREIGFFAIQGHYCSLAILERAWSETAAFFDLPAEEKRKSSTPNVADYPYGYEQNEQLSLGKRHQTQLRDSNPSNPVANQETVQPQRPDLKETFSIGPSNPDSGMPARRWPVQPPNFAAALTDYYQEMEQLSTILLQIFAVALKLPHDDWFVSKMDHHMSALRVLHYFPVPLTTQDLREGAIRASAHTDYGAFTILKSGGPGLQVKKDNYHCESTTDGATTTNEDDEWIDVPTLENVLIINLGDMMQRWTNGACVYSIFR